MPSLKNIFTAKGYEVGSDYKREVGADDNRCLIQYRVVADGVPTYLVIGDGYFKEIHTEELGSVVDCATKSCVPPNIFSSLLLEPLAEQLVNLS